MRTSESEGLEQELAGLEQELAGFTPENAMRTAFLATGTAINLLGKAAYYITYPIHRLGSKAIRALGIGKAIAQFQGYDSPDD